MIVPRRSFIKQVYDAAAMLAVLNALALAGVIGFLVMNGNLDVQKIQEMASVFRDAKPASPMPQVKNEIVADVKLQEPARAGFSPQQLDLVQLEAQRLKVELDQRVALANSIMLKVRTEREAFRKERDMALKQQEADRAKQQEQGFQKQLDVLIAMSPKMALEHILALNDTDKAARILVAMETDRAKKIVESAKRGDQLAMMKLILQRMQDVTPGPGGDRQAQANEP